MNTHVHELPEDWTIDTRPRASKSGRPRFMAARLASQLACETVDMLVWSWRVLEGIST